MPRKFHTKKVVVVVSRQAYLRNKRPANRKLQTANHSNASRPRARVTILERSTGTQLFATGNRKSYETPCLSEAAPVAAVALASAVVVVVVRSGRLGLALLPRPVQLELAQWFTNKAYRPWRIPAARYGPARTNPRYEDPPKLFYTHCRAASLLTQTPVIQSWASSCTPARAR